MSIQSDLAQEAKCFCFNDATERAVVVYLLLFKTGLLNMTPSQLAIAAKAYSYDLDSWKKIVAYLLAVDAGLQGDTPKQLADAAKCYCFDDGTWKKVVAFLLGSGGSGGPCPQDMQVVWTPTNLKLSELMGMGTNLSLSPQLPGITSLTFLQSVMANGQTEQISNAPNLVSISFPNLVTSGPIKILDAQNNPSLASVSFPIVTNTGLINIVNAPSLITFSCPLMVVGTPNLTGPSSLVVASFPSLVTSGNVIDFDTNANLTTLDLPSLVNAPLGFFCESNPSLTTVNVPSLVPVNNMGIDFLGCALNAASVNAILNRCVLNAAYTTDIIDLSGGTNAAPSGQGIADKATLIGRGVTVNTN